VPATRSHCDGVDVDPGKSHRRPAGGTCLEQEESPCREATLQPEGAARCCQAAYESEGANEALGFSMVYEEHLRGRGKQSIHKEKKG
jgi:hypothetical protein